MAISARYYSEFAGETFVIQAEAEAVENAATTLAVLRGIADLLRHGIRVLLVFGKGTQFEEELRTKYGARPHPETNRLAIPEAATELSVRATGVDAAWTLALKEPDRPAWLRQAEEWRAAGEIKAASEQPGLRDLEGPDRRRRQRLASDEQILGDL